MKGLLILGKKPPEDDEGGDDEPEEKSNGFGAEGFDMAAKAFVKAIGADPASVDFKKAAKALKAAIVACQSEDEDY